MNKSLTEDEQAYLIGLGILEDNVLTPKGKFYSKNFLKFFGSTQYITLISKSGYPIKERISRMDILLQYQPHSLHFKNGHLQIVKKFTYQKSIINPVIELIDKKDPLYKLYSKNNLRSSVISVVKTKSNKNYASNIEELKIIPVQVVYNYVNDFQKIETYESFLVDNKRYETILTLFVRLEGIYQAFNAEMAIHCMIEALRINNDIRYTELRHSISVTNNNECSILIYESELSGLLLYINTEELMITSKTVYAQFLQKMKGEQKNINQVYPIPTCQYEKKTKDFHLIYQVEDIINRICLLIQEMKDNFVKLK